MPPCTMGYVVMQPWYEADITSSPYQAGTGTRLILVLVPATPKTCGACWEPIGTKAGTSWEGATKIQNCETCSSQGDWFAQAWPIYRYQKRKEHCNSDGLLSELVLVLMYRVIDLGR